MNKAAILAAGMPVIIVCSGIAAGGGAPLADAGLDQTVSVDTSVQLDGTGSTPTDGEIESYEWRIETPEGREITPDCVECARTEFVPDVPGQYNATLTVRDSAGERESDTLHVDVENAGISVELAGNPTPEVGASSQYIATVETTDLELETITWEIDGGVATTEELSGQDDESVFDLSFNSVDDTSIRVIAESTNGRTDDAVLEIEPLEDDTIDDVGFSSSIESSETAEADCSDAEYLSENTDECLGEPEFEEPSIEMPNSVSVCKGETAEVDPEVDVAHGRSYSDSWTEDMPIQGDEIEEYSMWYSVYTDYGQFEAEELNVNVVDCTDQQPDDFESVIISGYESTHANAVSRDDFISVTDAKPVDEQSLDERVEHAGRGYSTLAETGVDILTLGSDGYVLEVERSREEAADIITRIENTEGGRWNGPGNKIALDSHRGLAEADVVEGLQNPDVSEVTMLFAIDYDEEKEDEVVESITEEENGSQDSTEDNDEASAERSSTGSGTSSDSSSSDETGSSSSGTESYDSGRGQGAYADNSASDDTGGSSGGTEAFDSGSGHGTYSSISVDQSSSTTSNSSSESNNDAGHHAPGI